MTKRTATIKALEECKFAVLDKKYFNLILSNFEYKIFFICINFLLKIILEEKEEKKL
jgi:hypothetical protein